MAISIKKAARKITNALGITAVDAGYEFANLPKQEEEFWSRISKDNKHAWNNLDPYQREWGINKNAYLGFAIDFFAEALEQRKQGGIKFVYSSDTTSSYIESIMSIILEGKPIAYYKTLPDMNFDWASLVDEDAEPDENGQQPRLVEPGEEAQFVQAMWDNIGRDTQARLGIHSFSERSQIEALLTSVANIFVGKKYDYETNDVREFIELLPSEDVGRDFRAEGVSDSRYILKRKWRTKYDILADHPEEWEKIKDASNTQNGKRKWYGTRNRHNEEDDHDILCYVTGWIRDNTQEKVLFNIDTGEQLTDDQAVELEQLEDEAAATDGTEPNPVVEERLVFKFPAGRIVKYLDKGDGDGSIIPLSIEENELNRIPCTIYKPHPLAGETFGRNVASNLVATHYAIDYFLQKAAKNVEDAGTTKIFVGRNSLADVDQLKKYGFQIVEVDNPGGIQVVQARGLADDSLKVVDALNSYARQMTGIEATSQGQSPGSIQSGKGLLVLTGQSNRKLAPSTNSWKETLVDVFQNVAEVQMQVLKKGMLMKVSGEDNTPYILPVDPAAVTASIYAESDADSPMPSSPTAKANLALSLLQTLDENGIPIGDRELVASFLGIPGMAARTKRVETQLQRKIEADAAKAAIGSGAFGAPPGTEIKNSDLENEENLGLEAAQSPSGI